MSDPINENTPFRFVFGMKSSILYQVWAQQETKILNSALQLLVCLKTPGKGWGWQGGWCLMPFWPFPSADQHSEKQQRQRKSQSQRSLVWFWGWRRWPHPAHAGQTQASPGHGWPAEVHSQPTIRKCNPSNRTKHSSIIKHHVYDVYIGKPR